MNHRMETYPELGIYEHYKSTPESRRLYEVFDFARHTETGEPLVLYKPLYEHGDPTGLTTQAHHSVYSCKKLRLKELQPRESATLTWN